MAQDSGLPCSVSRELFKGIPPFDLRNKVKLNSWDKETLLEIILQAHTLMKFF